MIYRGKLVPSDTAVLGSVLTNLSDEAQVVHLVIKESTGAGGASAATSLPTPAAPLNHTANVVLDGFDVDDDYSIGGGGGGVGGGSNNPIG